MLIFRTSYYLVYKFVKIHLNEFFNYHNIYYISAALLQLQCNTTRQKECALEESISNFSTDFNIISKNK